MGISRRSAALAASAALIGSLGVFASSGTANADGLNLYKGWGTGQCLSINQNNHALDVDSCTTANRWYLEATNHVDSDGYSEFLVHNYPTNLCIRADAIAERAGILLATCNPNDLNQVWDQTDHYDGSWQLKVAAPNSNLCLDRPTEVQFNGENVQMWDCASPQREFFLSNTHEEQRFDPVN